MIDPKSFPVRFSRLKNMAKSPAHYLHSLTHEHDSRAYRLGRLVHLLCSGGTWWQYEGTRRGKAWEKFRDEHEGEIFTEDEQREAVKMVTSMRADENAGPLLRLNGRRENKLQWTSSGRDCQGTPDFFNDNVLYDVKTCRTAEPDRFIREAVSYHYHSQIAWYQEAIGVVTGITPRDCYIIAVESKEPYPVTVLKLTDRALDQGRRIARLWFEQLLVCEASDRWPGYSQSIVEFDVPDPNADDLLFGDEDDESEAA